MHSLEIRYIYKWFSNYHPCFCTVKIKFLSCFIKDDAGHVNSLANVLTHNLRCTVSISKVFTEQSIYVALNIKHMATFHPTLILVLLITFSFVGATQGSVYCGPLDYCHEAGVVAIVWPLCHVLWILIIIHCLTWAEDIINPNKYHFVSS